MNIIWQNIFGLENPCLDNLLWNVYWLMRSITINIDSRVKYRAGVLHYIFSITCLFSYMYYYQFGMIYNIFWMYPVTGDILSVSIIISLAFASQISTVKLIAVFIFRKRLMKLMDKYKAFDSTLIPNSRYSNGVLKTLKIVKKRALIFWFTFCSTSAIYLLAPAFLPGHNLPENSLIAVGFTPVEITPNYEITYCILSFAGTFATAGIANVTVLLIVLSGYLEAHLLALKDEMDFIWPDALEYSNNPPDNAIIPIQKYVNRILGINIKRHIQLLDCHKDVKAIFNEVIALEFLFTTTAMCAMLLGGLEDTYLQIPFTISQLVVDTILGQRLIDSSIAFQDAVYRSGWENYNASNMKTLQIILQCSQKTLTLTAGYVTYLSYICFTSIVRFVYSAYATLRQAMD